MSLLLLFVVQGGCETFEETHIDPFEGRAAYFTLYGFLDASRPEQEIRVIPVSRIPERVRRPADPLEELNAVLSSTDLHTGEATLWRHSFALLSDQTYAHVYRSSFQAVPGHEYMIEVRRPDGKAATARTVVPDLESDFEPVVSKYVVSGDRLTQHVFLPGITRLVSVVVVYTLGNSAGDRIRFTSPYGFVGAADGRGGWSMTIELSDDAEAIRREHGPELFLGGIGLQVRWTDDSWPLLDESVDVAVLAQPGGFSNVTNGYGFVGSVGRYSGSWIVDDPDLTKVLGFR